MYISRCKEWLGPRPKIESLTQQKAKMIGQNATQQSNLEKAEEP